jgi:Fe-S cluster assembly scaffold protein SufB
MEKLRKIHELNDWYEEFDRKLPEWYRRVRLKARRIYEEQERQGKPIGRYGMDFDFTEYIPNIPQERKALKSLSDLGAVEREYAESVGINVEERERTGSHIQQDTTITYMGLSKWAKEYLLSKYPRGLEVEAPEVAILKYPWLENFVHKLVPIDLDKYTALCTAYSIGGAFIWVKRNVIVDLPLQACFLIETERIAQLPYILIIAEPYSKLNIVSGCVMNPSCTAAVHGCITEIYVGEGAEVTFNVLHNFKPGFHVRPKIGVMVDRGGTYIENYMEIGRPTSSQLYPTIILRGEESRAELRSFFFGRGRSDFDIGGAIIFTGENARGEVISRTVVTDESTVRMRGTLKSYSRGARGHLECRGLLLSSKARAVAYPNLKSLSPDSSLTHEAAIGKIEEEHLYYLMGRGLSKEEATSVIIRGFMNISKGLPPSLQDWANKLISMTAKEVM